MQHQELGRGELLGPLNWYKIQPIQAAMSSVRLGWVGMEAARYLAVPDSELNQPASTHHMLVLHTRPPEELAMRYEGVERYIPPPAGTISLIPAGCPSQWRWSGHSDCLHIFLDQVLVTRIIAETFDIDPARQTVPPFYGVDLPHLRAVMGTVAAELKAGSAGGQLVSDSLANVLAVHLIRHAITPRRLDRGRDGVLPQKRLRAVVEYIEDHLDANPTLEQMAAVIHLSPYHFTRQFKAATGMPPHQFVIARRVERAKQLLQGRVEFSMAQVAVRAGFSDPSHFSYHFKRLVGVTPRQFRTL